MVQIKDLQNHPIENVRLRAGDTSVSAPTDNFGEARIQLPPNTKPNNPIRLDIVGDPKGRELVFISPWDNWTRVPPFDNEAMNYVPVILAKRGERACLENSDCIRAAAARINKENAPRAAGERTSEQQSQKALQTVAKQFGLIPQDINQAIR